MLKAADIFSDHMVFQRRKPVRVFGRASAGAKVSVTLDGFTAGARAGADGRWLAELPPMEAGGPYELELENGQERLCFGDVYVGEVFILAGQSNIQFALGDSKAPPEDYISDDRLRFFMSDGGVDMRHFKAGDGWVTCELNTIGYWSAIGFYLGERISGEEGVTVGMICCYMGGTPIQTWMPLEAAADPLFQVPDQERYVHPLENIAMFCEDGVLWSRIVEPVLPFSAGSVVWYQGENNSSVNEAAVYDKMLKALVESWRLAFRDPELVFYIVQISDFDDRKDPGWKGIQDAQAAFCDMEAGCKLIISKDVCDSYDVHPPLKKALAFRIADSFQNRFYRK